MEILNSQPLPLAFALFLFIFLLMKIVKGTRNSEKLKLPPGPWKLPFIGNIHQLVGSQTHHILRDLAHKYGPIMSLQFGEVSAIVVSSPEVAQEILKTHDLHFAQRPFFLSGEIIAYNFSDIVFSPYGEYWRTLRKICTMELFSVKSVQKFRPVRESEVSNLIKTLSENVGRTINLGQEFFTLTIGITARAGFGKRVGEEKVFGTLIQELVDLSSGFSVADMYPSLKFLHLISRVQPRLEKVYKGMDKVFGDIISEHRKRKVSADQEDLADVLLRVQKDGLLECPITDDNIKAVILDIITAGSETSTATMTWAMSELIKNPKKFRPIRESEVSNLITTISHNVGKTINLGKELFTLTIGITARAGFGKRVGEEKVLAMLIQELLDLSSGFSVADMYPSLKFLHLISGVRPRMEKVYQGMNKVFGDIISEHRKRKAEADQEDLVDVLLRVHNDGLLECPVTDDNIKAVILKDLSRDLICTPKYYAWTCTSVVPCYLSRDLSGGLKNEELDMTEEFGITLRRKRDLNVIPIARKISPTE
ncbi:premnaspirodiene oxygenase-like [Heracleum sosnowskyi]|uniref:Premnaspirodiene oxygenase-like n=1 Tax=Heracleum sosnowskyi TaxID=360622 RepID=A0AAD8JN83_9APIA|nr:premnaspirodiene oxygenase-like [Heracleum sosnowskyi]